MPGSDDEEEEGSDEADKPEKADSSAKNDDDDDNDSIASSQMTGTSYASSNLSRQSSFKMESFANSNSASLETVSKLVVGLNNMIGQQVGDTNYEKFDSDVISWILHMAFGNYKYDNLKMLKKFVHRMNQLEISVEGTPAVTLLMAKQLVAFACGMYEHWEPEMWDRWDRFGL